MKNSIRLLAIAIFAAANASAQTSVNHLLWRISGNGLSKPSYLYGTMHLTDKRLFFFGDSLYRALEQTEGFAAEVDFNAFLGKYFEAVVGARGQESYIKSRLDENALQQRAGKLEKKFKKPVDKITMEDLDKEESRRRSARLKSGEMETFMDAYLLGLADKQGKWIGGIEDPEDQLNLSDAFDTESRIDAMIDDQKSEKSQYEWMIQTYLKENLELIDRSNELWMGAKDIVLIRRNLKMAKRLDSIMQLRTCLFAIGAAHLPGDSGVVQLLRNHGYEVTPVISSKKINPKDYTYTEVRKEWVEVWGKDSLFSVKMPMQPSPMSMFGEVPLDMQFAYDLPSNTAYFTGSVPMVGMPAGSEDSIMASLSKHYSKAGEDFVEKDITLKGNKGKEFIMGFTDGYLRVRVFLPNRYLSMQMLAVVKKEALYSENAIRYFNSFNPDTARAAANLARNEAAGLQTVSYAADGFSIQLFAKLKRRKVDIGNNGWRRIMVDGANPKNQAYYVVTIDATTAGHYSNNDSVYFKDNEKAILEKINGKLISSKELTVEGYPAFEMLAKTSKFEKEIKMRLLFVNRGNKRYTLTKTFDPSIDSAGMDDPFFSSLHFLPFETDHWKRRTVAGEYSTYAPSEATIDTFDNGIILYQVYDSASGVSYSVSKEVFSKYFWFTSEDSLFERVLQTHLREGDSVLEKKRFREGNAPCMDVLIGIKDSRSIKRTKVLLNGDTLYAITGVIPPELLTSPVYTKYFDEFKPLHAGVPTTMFASKAKLVLHDLKSEDSATFAEAKSRIDNLAFTQADLPLLHQAMLYPYNDYEEGANFIVSTAGNSIAKQLIRLDTSGQNTAFIKQHYGSLTGSKAFLRYMMLSILSKQHTSASYDLLKDLLKEPLPEAKGYLSFDLLDSLSLSKRLFPEVFECLGSRTLRWQMSRLTEILVDSGQLDISVIREYKEAIVEQVAVLLSMSTDELDNTSYQYLPLIGLLAKLKDPEMDALLMKIGKMKALNVSEAALMALLSNGGKITAADLVPLAGSDQYRLSLYERLEEEKKLNLFPPQFLTQRLLAQSRVFSEGSDDAVTGVTYLKEKIIEFGGKKQKFYLFKVIFDEDDGEGIFLGIAGPYSLNIKDMKTDDSGTGIHRETAFDAKKIDALFDEWLKQFSEEDVEEPPVEE